MRYDHLPIYSASMELCVYVEESVKQFDKYYKYTTGEDLRVYSKELLFMIHRANKAAQKEKELEKLVCKCEEMKMLIHLAKELKAFKSFKQFEMMSKKTVAVCKQAQGWLNHFAGVIK